MSLARIESSDVTDILDTDLSPSVIEAYINAAHLHVEGVLGTSDLSEDELTAIEQWFCCHLISATRERQASKEQIGATNVTYEGVTGKGLDSTMYGQTVKMLDRTGLLAKYEGGMKTVEFFAVKSFDSDDVF